MKFAKRAPKYDWRKSLTTEEANEVATIDARMAALDEERHLLSFKLHRIRNRGWKRAEAEAQATATSSSEAAA